MCLPVDPGKVAITAINFAGEIKACGSVNDSLNFVQVNHSERVRKSIFECMSLWHWSTTSFTLSKQVNDCLKVTGCAGESFYHVQIEHCLTLVSSKVSTVIGLQIEFCHILLISLSARILVFSLIARKLVGYCVDNQLSLKLRVVSLLRAVGSTIIKHHRLFR